MGTPYCVHTGRNQATLSEMLTASGSAAAPSDASERANRGNSTQIKHARNTPDFCGAGQAAGGT
ncbi:hypothetical protein GCM10011600_26310 [Pseudolysinimonas yzui]|uniref:Uncharacterized protein n=1 Tax=Pseudolysinimonas yzui TaxID=2708254 RepID=A0A8J3GS31_9MICO|nr:hypothetical protein GCM10011600_26310 [Pseudolysinimonas yzui]